MPFGNANAKHKLLTWYQHQCAARGEERALVVYSSVEVNVTRMTACADG